MPKGRKCAIEPLESRVLLAGHALANGHIHRKVVFTGEIDAEGEPDSGISAPADLIAPESVNSGSTIESINFDQGAATTGFYQIPPDSHMAAGPNHVVNVVNSTIEWYTKAGTRQNRQRLGKNGSTATGSFFASLTPVNGTFDPKVVYDPYNGRFVVVTLEQTSNTSRLLVAVSDDSDPNGTWFFGAIDTKITITGQSRWMDYPGLAVDSSAIYVTGNMFTFGANGSFGGSRLLIIPKTPLYTGGAITSTMYDPSTLASLGSQAFTLQPSQMYGTTPGSTGTFLVSSQWSSGSTDRLSVIRVDNPLGSPTFSNQFVSLGDIHNAGASFPGDVPQLGTTEPIDGGDPRVYSTVWRNNALWVANTVNPPSGVDAGTATAHWYKVNTTNLASLTLADQGNISGEDLGAGTRTFYPAITVDSAGNMGIGFGASGPNIYPGAYYTGHETTDAAGTVQPSVALAAGQDFYFRKFGGDRNRWGDYSGISIDPADDSTFWIFNEYALTRGTVLSQFPTEDGRWGTRIGSFSFQAPPPPTGAISGIVYRDNNTSGTQTAGELGIDGVTVFLDGNNNTTLDFGESTTTTGGGGGYTFSGLVTGTYNVRQIRPTGHIFTAPSTGVASVAVTNGSTTNQNFADFPTIFNGSSSDDVWTLRTDPTLSLRVQVLETLSGGSTTTYQILKSTFNTAAGSFTFNGVAGNDTVTIDNTAAASIPTAGVTVNGGANTTADQLIFNGGTGSDTLSIGNGTATFSGNVTYSGIEALAANLNAGADTLNFNGPLPAPLTFTGGSGADIFNLNSGSYTFNSDVVTATPTLKINVNAGSAIFNSSQHIAGLTIASGASATMSTGGNRFLQTGDLSIVGTGKLDLSDNDLIVDYTSSTPLTQIRQWILDGFSGAPDASKSGIVSTAGQNAGGSTIHAVFDTALSGGGEWPAGSGNTTDATAVIAKYTYFGDVNLDGQVTGDDYTIIDSNLNTTPPVGLAWPSGDANLDGIVTGDDYTTIDSNLGLGASNPL